MTLPYFRNKIQKSTNPYSMALKIIPDIQIFDLQIYYYCFLRRQDMILLSYWQNIWIHYYYMSHIIWIHLDCLTRHMNPLTLFDKIWIHLQLLTWHMNPHAWQEISIHLYCMKKHLNPIAELDWHMNPHTLLGKMYESTYTAWQDMNPLTVNDMTYESTYTAWQNMNPVSYWHMNPHTAWQDMNPLVLLDKTYEST